MSSRAYGRIPTHSPGIDWPGLIQVGGVLLAVVLAWYGHSVYVARQEEWSIVEKWLKSHDLTEYQSVVQSIGIHSMKDVEHCHLPLDPHVLLPAEIHNKLQMAIQMYQDERLLFEWLEDHGLDKYSHRLKTEGIYSLHTLCQQSEYRLTKILESRLSAAELEMFRENVLELKKIAPHFSDYRARKSGTFYKLSLTGLLLLSFFLLVMIVAMNINSAYALFLSQQRRKRSLLEFMTGQYLSLHQCTVKWHWTDPQVVGNTHKFSVEFYKRNGQPYHLTNQDNILVEIRHGATLINSIVTIGGSTSHIATVGFTVHRSGTYHITLMVGGRHIGDSPYQKSFLPGVIEPRKSQVVSQNSIVVCHRGRVQQLMVEPRDEYSNLCEYSADDDLASLFTVTMMETGSQTDYSPLLHCVYDKTTKQISLRITLNQQGCYHTTITYQGSKLRNSDFHIIVLNEKEASVVSKAVAKRSHSIPFESRLLSTNYHSPTDRGKKVYCYISPKQLTIKEFHLKIFPKKLYTFRVCPSTKFQFLGIHNQLETPVLSIDDGCQTPVLLASKDRNIIAATFSSFLMQNIGGSETFKDKQDFFYHEIRQLHTKRIHDRIILKIQRDKLMESSLKVAKNFSTSEWCKKFEIMFHQEEGLDWGGVRREWFELLCTELFDPTKSNLFMRFTDDPQALSHPNPCRPAYLKLKYYEFAGKIVGKSLYESALGGGYRQLIKAKFSRSFLAQLIGLRVNYKYFEKDDPDLYVTKIRFIEENDVDDLELTFAEEEFVDGKLDKVVDLIPNGSKTPVTEANKFKYLDSLAQYRLANKVHDEIEYFLKGLNELIPDNLLSIFDENELELLMCGTGNYSLADFRQHHTVSGSSPEFHKVLEWFWTIVAGFTQEEMARLLQFTTGCSQLPSEGFSQLTPKFQILATPTYNVLPTAHTCFNQLCLPDYDSLEEMHHSLRLAITEGNQGFGMV